MTLIMSLVSKNWVNKTKLNGHNTNGYSIESIPKVKQECSSK